MTVQEVSTLIRERCPALFVIINNDGYLIERQLHKDGMYNDIQMWQYAKLPGMFGDGTFVTGLKVTTEEELEQAMKIAVREKEKLVFIEACLPNRDCSAGLKRLGDSYRQPQKKS
jgi:TPP-dependent 2-oxoacid decarboxylase